MLLALLLLLMLLLCSCLASLLYFLCSPAPAPPADTSTARQPHNSFIIRTGGVQFAFHLFAVHNDEGGCLTPKLLGSFLGSFATVLCACTEEGMEMAPEMLRSVISAASETAVTSLLGGLFDALHAVLC